MSKEGKEEKAEVEAEVEAEVRKVNLNKLKAARLEKKGPGPVVEFGELTIQCPPEIPFAVVEAFARMETASAISDGERATQALVEAVKGILGSRFEDFMAMRPSAEDMSDLIEGVFNEYGVGLGESAASPTS